MKTLRLSAVLAACGCAWGGYQSIVSDTLSTIDSTKWAQTGNLSTTANGITGNGSLISKATLPNSDYDLRAVVHTVDQKACTGSQTLFARSNGDQSTSYVLRINNGSAGLFKVASNSWTALSWLPYSCADGSVLRLVVRGGDLTMWSGPNSATYHDPAPLAAGQPGLGISSNDSIGNIQIGPIDSTPPAPVNPASVQYSITPRRIDLRWTASTDDANGIGLSGYILYRDGIYLGTTQTPYWVDETITNGSGTYSIYASDEHGNISAPAVANVGSSARISAGGPEEVGRFRSAEPHVFTSGPTVDQRRVGVQPNGAYWGAAGEQIDMLSANLNFSVPVMQAMGRAGWKVTFGLSYNSQIWRQDSGGIWLLGEDVGVGLGWKLLAGSVRPVWLGGTFLYYVYTDATGAEYVLDQQSGSVWSSVQGVYVYFDASTDILHFRDGTFWNMSVQSGSTEPDAGTLYPSVMEDSNGNQILISYLPAVGYPYWYNNSSRISAIDDTRLVCFSGTCSRSYGDTYNLTWSGSGIPHLNSLHNNVGTPENYSFGMTTQSLLEPFGSTLYSSVSTTLQSITVTGLGIAHQFQYGLTTGEMTQMTTPLGGVLRWAYRTFAYPNRSYREVQTRYIRSIPTASEYEYDLYFWGGTNWHGDAAVYDSGAGAEKVWSFSTLTDYTAGLVTSYYEYGGSNELVERVYQWTQNPAGVPYISWFCNVLDPVTHYTAAETTQVEDAYGNLTQQQVYDFGNPSTPARTYNFTYTASYYPTYTSLYVFNRLVTATVTPYGGSPVTLASRTYDNSYSCGGISTSTALSNHDAAYGTGFVYRGNLTQSTGPNGTDTVCSAYDTAGVLTNTVGPTGTSVAVTTDSSTNATLPHAIQPNGNSAMQTSVTYASSFAVASVTGPNGAPGTTTYDTYGRPSQTQSPDGAITTYTYSYSPAPTQTATVNGRWKTTTLEGFGRAIKVQTGNGTTTVSTVDTTYAPCGCSPLLKVSAVSQPYAPGATPVWTTYQYDGSGRTINVTSPDGTSHSQYTYQGNNTTVTDAAGKWKTSTVDVFGNLIVVTEPNPAGGGNLQTSYTYTPLSQLSQVTMTRGTTTQYRYFSYTGTDLTSAYNPENGTVTYTYDNAHHVKSRTDAIGNVTQYTYDSYGRRSETQSYPTTLFGGEDYSQRVNYTYDAGLNGMGRLTGVSFGAGVFEDLTATYTTHSFAYGYGYNPAGRITSQSVSVQNATGNYTTPLTPASPPVVSFSVSYQWDNEGRMTSMQSPTATLPAGSAYPNPVVLPTEGFQYDANGHLGGMTWDTGSGPTPYASATYGPAGEMLTVSYGGMNETRTYNSLLQLTSQYVPGYMSMTYYYSATQNNGRITNSLDAVFGESTTYSYDSLNRLTGASNGIWNESYGYDGFDNLTSKSGSAGAPTLSATYDAYNHQVGVSYDANGNLLSVTGQSNSYSVENRLNKQIASVWPYASTMYSYDPNGKRVMKRYDPDPNSYSTGSAPQWEYYLYGITGQKLVTVGCNNPSGTGVICWAVGENVYFGSKLLVSNGVYVTTDRLGSVRANSLGEYFAYYPYGEERSTHPDGRDKFAMYFRDTAGQDYADQRYYNSGVGRFWSTDSGSSSATSPGTLNRYAYVAGDPINNVDPQGRDLFLVGGAGSGKSCTLDGIQVDCSMVCNPTGGIMDGFLGFGDPFAENPCDSSDGDGPIADSGGGAPQLKCKIKKTKTPKGHHVSGSHDTNGEEGPAYEDIFVATAVASGGVGSYTFKVSQTYSNSGTITYANQAPYSYPTGSITDSLTPDEFSQNGGTFTFEDDPNIWASYGGNALVAAMVTVGFTTNISVTSGGQTVSCGTITWSAAFNFSLGKNGRPVFKGQARVTGIQP